VLKAFVSNVLSLDICVLLNRFYNLRFRACLMGNHTVTCADVEQDRVLFYQGIEINYRFEISAYWLSAGATVLGNSHSRSKRAVVR
jgi:hypothetical protein